MKRRDFIKKLAISTSLPFVTTGFLQCGKSQQPLPESVLLDVNTILFIGDSITFAAGYIDYIQTFLISKYPEKQFTIYGMGLSSETVCGLTETKHPYPRPNIHDRLQRVLDRTQPDLVVACYGMNDGIYHPLADERFTPFKAGITRLIERVTETGASLYLLTPPPFDAVAAADRVVDENADRFGYDATYQGYDDVLDTYGKWILQQTAPGLTTVDIHTPMHNFIMQQREHDPEFYLARDGVHPGAVGHWLMARTLLEAWNEFPVEQRLAARIGDKTITGNTGQADFSGGDVQFDWALNIPVALHSNETRGLTGLDIRLIWPVLQVEQSSVAGYKCYDGEKLFQSFKKAELEKGVDLSAYPSFDLTRQGVKLLNLVRQRRHMYDHALLADIGHSLPQIHKPMTLPEAESHLPELDAAIQDLSRPVVVNMRLVPYI